MGTTSDTWNLSARFKSLLDEHRWWFRAAPLDLESIVPKDLIEEPPSVPAQLGDSLIDGPEAFEPRALVRLRDEGTAHGNDR